jgi:hypothetical protein
MDPLEAPLPGRFSGSWFALLPVPSHPRRGQWHSRVSSPFTAAGPRGTYTLFPYPGVKCGGHSRRQGRRLSSSLMSFGPSPVHVLTRPWAYRRKTGRKTKAFQSISRHRLCSSLYRTTFTDTRRTPMTCRQGSCLDSAGRNRQRRCGQIQGRRPEKTGGVFAGIC